MLVSGSPIADGVGCPKENGSARCGGATALQSPVSSKLAADPATARTCRVADAEAQAYSTSIAARR